ncbi:MAG: (2Fe-2S)-binding protein [Gammaproteobacteria bacterium]|nr:MAG: (2Fe-2S)-binding protein [Gammaproteobacteria bacterium]
MRRIERHDTAHVRIEFEGQALLAQPGDTVAAALLAGNHWCFRTTPVSGAPRGPFCMMGVCFDCLVEIDGVANRQACMIEVRDGMRVKRQQGASDIGPHLFADGDQESAP